MSNISVRYYTRNAEFIKVTLLWGLTVFERAIDRIVKQQYIVP